MTKRHTTYALALALAGIAILVIVAIGGVPLTSPRPLALHDVMRADVVTDTCSDDCQSYLDLSREMEGGTPGGPFHIYTVTDASRLAQLARMLNALPVLAGTPTCARRLRQGPTWATAGLLLRTRSGQSVALYLDPGCGLVNTASLFGGATYYADTGNSVFTSSWALIHCPDETGGPRC